MARKKTVYDNLTYAVIGAAMTVHRTMGPGYPEKVYQKALLIELERRDIRAQEEVIFEVGYRNQGVGEFHIDVLVDEAIIVELKALDALNDACKRQVISYLTATGRDVGLLLNFGAASLQHKRIFPPRSVQNSRAFQQKHQRWYSDWQSKSRYSKEPSSPYQLSDKSVQSVDLLRTDFTNLEPYTPGVYYTELAARLGRDLAEMVKLDANENPYGPPPAALRTLAELQTPHRYPELQNRHLRQALADFTGVPMEQLLAGAGSDELLRLTLQLLIEPGDAVLNCPPTFGMYAFFAGLAGARVINVPRRDDFSLDLEAVEAAIWHEQPKLLFLCSPNNPTGTFTADADLRRLLELSVIVLLDEAYVEFSGTSSRMPWATEHDNLIVLRTFSKWGGLAGLRVGYGAFPTALMPHLWKIKEPYTVSVAAEAAARAALTDIDTLNARRDRIATERERLLTQLEQIPSLTPTPSQANFIYCTLKGRDPETLRAALEAQGILLRWYSGTDVVRISVGTPEQNDQLIAALER